MKILLWIRRVLVLVHGAWLLAMAGALPADAQSYPSQPIKIVVPFPAGGGVDVVARLIAPRLSEALGASVTVENRGGAGGALGAAAVAKAAPDGYTFLLGTGGTHGTNPVVYSKIPYHAVRDFTPVVLVSSSALLLVTNPSVPAKSVKELIALARAEPGKFSYGSFGVGSISHLAGELFNSMANIQTTHVPYRGSAPAMTDLIGGRIQYMFDGIATSLGHIRAGKTRLLGVSAAERSPVLPNDVTISEAGLPGFEAIIWFGLFAPAGTPQPIVNLLNEKMNSVLAIPAVKDGFLKLGMQPVGGAPDVLAKKVDAELAKWGGLVRKWNIRIDP